VNEVRSVLLVAHRKEIKAGTYDVEQDMARKWQQLGPEGQSPYQKRLEKGQEYEGYREAVEKDIGKYVGEKETREAEEDVEMGEDGEDDEEA